MSTASPWKEMPGRYTREGDVRELVAAIDDQFVVSRPGDAIAVAFPAAGNRGREGFRREPGREIPRDPYFGGGETETMFLFAHGYSKEMDINSASPDQAAPLPFRAMTRYPYTQPEAYPSTPAHRGYLERYNTRVVGRALPSM